jgi:hypothetical protein
MVCSFTAADGVQVHLLFPHDAHSPTTLRLLRDAAALLSPHSLLLPQGHGGAPLVPQVQAASRILTASAALRANAGERAPHPLPCWALVVGTQHSISQPGGPMQV